MTTVEEVLSDTLDVLRSDDPEDHAFDNAYMSIMKLIREERQKVLEEVLGLIAKDIASVHYKMVASKNIGGQLQFRKGKFDGLTKLYKKVELNQLKGT